LDVRRDSVERIAVVGVACRFPQAADPEQLWHTLAAGRDAITEVPKERFSIEAFHDPDPEARGKIRSRFGGFVEDIDRFDPELFGISPREARQIDPQQRFMLELAFEALEDAAIAPDTLARSKTGVFFGAMWDDYGALLYEKSAEVVDRHAATGTARSLIANRVSHVLGLRGPSIAVDTASSSSLVAVHLACQSLRLGESTLALAGGVNLILTPKSSILISRMGAMAPDGRSKVFDESADGYVRAEGAGVVVLKPLALALADGDPIYCVILASAVNNDGTSDALSVPSQEAQEELLRAAYASAGVDPTRVDYVEAHGTGTSVGDPIEARALGGVLGRGRAPNARLRVGSIKTNLGHLEAAAGIAGLIKVALSMKNREIPRTLHFRRPHPEIDLGALGLSVQTEHASWPERDVGGRPLAGVSSFGFGGTNAHVVVEGAPPRQVMATSQIRAGREELVVLSAHSPEALKALAAETARRIEDDAPLLRDLAYTSLCRRAHHAHRLALVADSTEAAARALSAHARGLGAADLREGRRSASGPPKLAFCFLGARVEPGAARELFEREPSFRQKLLECSRILEIALGTTLADRLYGCAGTLSAAEAFAASLAVELSLSALWRARGIRPSASIGLGGGALASRVDAGELDLASALAERDAFERSPTTAPIDRELESVLVMGSAASAGSALAALSRTARETIFSLDPLKSDLSAILAATGALYANGLAIDGRALHPEAGAVARFPRYPFQRKRYWWPEPDARSEREPGGASHERDSSKRGATEPLDEVRTVELRWTKSERRSGAPSGRPMRFVLAGGGAFGAELKEALISRGHRAELAEREGHKVEPRARVVHLAGLEVGSVFEDFERARTQAATAESMLVDLVSRAQKERSPMWIVTRGAQAASEGPTPIAVGQASLWGRGVGLSARMIDLDPASPRDTLTQLADELCTEDGDARVAFREGARWVGRIVPRAAVPSAPIDRSEAPDVELAITSPGIIDDLELIPVKRSHPRPTEVEIEVVSAGLNFRDVLQTLGLYPGDPFPLGGECAGVVSRVGSEVTRFQEGDEVFALFGRTAMFRRFANADARFVAKKPENLGFEAAATSPIVFLTAIHGLYHLGRMKRGERILIHAAAGGVGLAAVQLALRSGLEVYGTAGDDRKRDLLLSLGVRGVMSSRSPDFAERIMAITGGRGVDLVLNSLAGEMIERSISVLAPQGRFLEMGKNGIWTTEQVHRIRPDVLYAAFDLQAVARERPEHIEALLGDLARELELGQLRPLPYRGFPLVEAKSAFRHMAKARHVGKVAITVAPLPPPRRHVIKRPATYLVLGDFERLGASVAAALSDLGVDRVVIASTSPIATRQDTPRGVTFEVLSGTSLVDMERLLQKIDAVLPPLRGVVVTVDAKTDDPSPAVLAHLALRGRSLDLFAMLSSASDGTRAFFEALAHHRRASGLSGTSIGWADPASVPPPATVARLLEEDFLGAASPVTSGKEPSHFRERIEACPPAERRSQMLDCVQAHAKGVLELDDSTALALDARFVDAGMDSKMIEELARSLSAAIGAPVRSSTVYGCATIAALSAHLLEELSPSAAPQVPADPENQEILERVSSLSEASAEALMMEKLAELEPLLSE
jgi:acyl transferase domain-containing protein/NADPH:quinone reductase-like Zn-dependent oxidoreductase